MASAFFRPAATAIVRDILPPELLVSASSLSSLGQSLALFLVGPLAGGVIVATAGTGWAFGIDGASFAVSAACLAAMRRTAGLAPPENPGDPDRNLIMASAARAIMIPRRAAFYQSATGDVGYSKFCLVLLRPSAG